jgi:molybdopterin-guanine dinucleotide biosynthesis protein A
MNKATLTAHSSLTNSALILGGGRSVRMGYDKKKLELGGVRVLNSLITRLQTVFSEVIVSTNEPLPELGVITLHDEIGAGPLAGIYQGLRHCRSEYLYVVACDMPFISLEYIQYLQGIVNQKPVDACVARRDDGRYEPFNSFFNKRCIEPLYEALVRGEYKISILLDRLNLHIVDAATAKTFNAGDMFFNINDKADLARAEDELHKG